MQNDDKSVYDNSDVAEYDAKLDAITNDPNASYEDKADAISQAIDDELDEISSATEVTADPSYSAPDYSAPDYSAPDSATAPTTEVTADPSTATYGEPAATPIASATPAPAPAPAPAPETSTVNDEIGVSGNVDYVSPRDVDGDGLVDLTHSRVDGIDTITHYDEDGSITLIEQDTDSNGTYETAAAQQPDGTVRIAEDLDDDGDVDLATFHDPVSGAPVRQDTIEGSAITETLLDTDGDGHADTRLIDSNGDGQFDAALVDTDGDSYTNASLVDTDADGQFDLASVDTDGDGTLDTVVTGAEADLSSVESLEASISAGEDHHDPAGTYPADPHSDIDA
ncbi:hypothetical protein [Rhodococcus sp. 1R11]|uniref:hypothetical protein n=1 Tax=Rhodococcus sp. 1R11 TaxID=2559614 RepID=UPI001ADBE5C3|nr:hypothetical protein [Rhodococcus sp. 1R11]